MKHTACFLHIPKTAGKSVKSAIQKYPHVLYIGHQILSQKPHTYTFCYIRNPFSRVVSVFNYLLANGEGNIDDVNDRKRYLKDLNESDFDIFVREYLNTAAIQQQHFKPMHHYILSGKKTLVDDAFKFENIQNNWKIACEKIQIPFEELPRVNTSKKVDYTDYYNDKTKDAVARVYRKDLELFNYEFGE